MPSHHEDPCVSRLSRLCLESLCSVSPPLARQQCLQPPQPQNLLRMRLSYRQPSVSLEQPPLALLSTPSSLPCPLLYFSSSTLPLQCGGFRLQGVVQCTIEAEIL